MILRLVGFESSKVSMVTDLDWLAWSFKSAIDGGQRPSKGVSYWLLICKANPRFPGSETCGFLWRIVGDAPWVALGALPLGALVKWNRGSPPFSSPWSKALAPRRFNTFQHVARCFEMFQRFSWISAVSNLVPSSGCSMFSWLAGRSWRHLKTLLVVGRDGGTSCWFSHAKKVGVFHLMDLMIFRKLEIGVSSICPASEPRSIDRVVAICLRQRANLVVADHVAVCHRLPSPT